MSTVSLAEHRVCRGPQRSAGEMGTPPPEQMGPGLQGAGLPLDRDE